MTFEKKIGTRRCTYCKNDLIILFKFYTDNLLLLFVFFKFFSHKRARTTLTHQIPILNDTHIIPFNLNI